MPQLRPVLPLPRPGSIANLTFRERQIVVLLSKGYSNSEIAGLLHLSTSTINNTLIRIYSKTGIHRRAQLAVFVDRELERIGKTS